MRPTKIHRRSVFAPIAFLALLVNSAVAQEGSLPPPPVGATDPAAPSSVPAGGGLPADPNANAIPSAPSATSEAKPEEDAKGKLHPQGLFVGFMDPFPYDPRGRRNPFAQLIDDKPLEEGYQHGPLLPLQQFELTSLRLVGILWDVKKPKAMILDPNNNTHIVSPNAKIGPRNGYVAVIREGEIVVVETVVQNGRLVSTAQVVKIAR